MVFDQAAPRQAEQARDVFKRGGRGKLKLVLKPLTVAEMIYGLVGIHGYTSERVKGKLLALMSTDAFKVEYDRAVSAALSQLGTKLDFPDTYLAARARRAGGQAASFDKGFGALAVGWLEPGGEAREFQKL